jgi:hypothetical protein
MLGEPKAFIPGDLIRLGLVEKSTCWRLVCNSFEVMIAETQLLARKLDWIKMIRKGNYPIA